MKKLIILLALGLLTQSVQAQLFSSERLSNLETFDAKFLTWGYFLGFNSYDFKIEYNDELGNTNTDVIVEPTTGFNVGLIGDMRISKYINLRLEPGLYFTQRNLIFPRIGDEIAALREVKSTYIHLPLLLKFSTKRLNNWKPFVVGGVSTSLNLSSNEKNPEDNSLGHFRTTRITNYFELGFGVDIYLYFFKFTPTIRGVFATSNELVPDNNPLSQWTSNLSAINSRGVFINFTFQ